MGQIKTVIIQGDGEQMEQMECHIEMGLEGNFRANHVSFYMKVGSLNSKVGA